MLPRSTTSSPFVFRTFVYTVLSLCFLYSITWESQSQSLPSSGSIISSFSMTRTLSAQNSFVVAAQSCENGVCENDSNDPPKSSVVVLTSANFEHETQVSTGATTGDWLIKFYAPWCGHCRRLQPAWEELATKLKEENAYVNVAKVDVTANPEFRRRFDIKGYPTLLFFSKGKMYPYKGPRDVQSLYNFVTNGFRSQSYNIVPSPPTIVGDLLKLTREINEEANILIKNFPNKKPSDQFIIVSVVIVLAFILFALILVLVLTIPPNNQTAQKKRKRRGSNMSTSVPEKKHKGLTETSQNSETKDVGDSEKDKSKPTDVKETSEDKQEPSNVKETSPEEKDSQIKTPEDDVSEK